MILHKSAKPGYILIRGIFSILIGITIIAIPEISMKVFVQFLGCVLIINGVANFITGFRGVAQQSSSFLVVPGGITSFIAGTVFVLFPSFVAGIFIFVISFILIIAGITILGTQLGNRNASGFSWFSAIFSVLAIAAGIFMIINPSGTELTIMKIVGGFISIYGIGKVIWSFRIKKNLKQPPREPNIIDAEYEEVE